MSSKDELQNSPSTITMAQKARPKHCQFPTCKKKLLLTDFACRCGNIYCCNHRLSEQHVCPHNYFKDHQDVLLKTMSSAVVAAKVDTI